MLLFYSCENASEPELEDKSLQYYDKESVEIDINKDGIADLKREIKFYQHVSGPTVHFYILPLNSAEILCEDDNKPIRLMANDTIFYTPKRDDLSWYPNFVNMIMCDYYYKNWVGKWAGLKGFIAIKIKKDSTYQTSWVHVLADTLRERNIIFYSSRYQEDPECGILVR